MQSSDRQNWTLFLSFIAKAASILASHFSMTFESAGCVSCFDMGGRRLLVRRPCNLAVGTNLKILQISFRDCILYTVY